MEIVDGVYALQIEVSVNEHELVINPMAVQTPNGLVLIDVGMPNGTGDLEAALAAEGLDLDDVWGVIITHQDIDHAGCLATVVERTDAVVFAHEADAPYLEGEKDLVKSTMERPMTIEPTIVDVRLTDRETFATAAGPMQAIFTPGHAPGHTAFYFSHEKLLITGDALNVVDETLVGPRDDAAPELKTAWESVETLADLDINHTFCFHGGYVEEGTDRIKELLAAR